MLKLNQFNNYLKLLWPTIEFASVGKQFATQCIQTQLTGSLLPTWI